MEKWVKILIIIIGVIYIILNILFIAYLIKSYVQYDTAFTFASSNDLYCGKEVCLPEITDMNPPTFTENYNLDMAKYCANLVYRVEHNTHFGKLLLPSGLKLLQKIYNPHDDSLFGLILYQDNQTIWIAFRGTTTLYDWSADLLDSQRSYFFSVKNAQSDVKLTANMSVKIHQGFLNFYNEMKQKIYDSLKNITYSNIVISGHSLGAAIAIICGLDLTTKGNKCIVYNFACPRVGNKEFGELVNSSMKYYRIVNTCDLIPDLPLSVTMNYNEPEKPFFYQHCGTGVYFTDNWKSMTNNHLMGVYTNFLNKSN